jgi:hypothetical protein
MQAGTRSTQGERVGEGTCVVPAPRCPVCSGPLVLLRDHYRCARCCYSVCAGCDAAAFSPPAAD